MMNVKADVQTHPCHKNIPLKTLEYINTLLFWYDCMIIHFIISELRHSYEDPTLIHVVWLNPKYGLNILFQDLI